MQHIFSSAAEADSFFAEHWQRTPHHISRNDPSFYDDVFDIRCLEEMWTNVSSNDPTSLLLFQKGKQVAGVKNAFFAFAHRCSVVVNRADRHCRAVHQLCLDLQKNRFPFVFCNVYLTPPNAQTVPAHSDDREVFLLQIYGEKEWTVYGDPPSYPPYKEEELGKTSDGKYATIDSDDASVSKKFDASTLPIAFKKRVKAGDFLYLPRGHVHEAKTTDSASLHLTIAVQSSDWDISAVIRDGAKAILRDPSFGLTARQTLSLPALAAASTNPHCDSSNTPVSGNSPDAEKKKSSTTKTATTRHADPTAVPNDDAEETNTGGNGDDDEDDGDDMTAEEDAPGVTAADEAQFQAVLQALASELTLKRSFDSFRSRLERIRMERDVFVASNLRVLANPVTPDTLVLWNPLVKILGMKPIQDENIPQLAFVCGLERKEPQGTMTVSLSEETRRALAVLHGEARTAAVKVRDFPGAFDILSAMCIANWLTRNGCLLRVS